MVFCKPDQRDFSPGSENTESLDNFLEELYDTHPLPGLAVGIVSEQSSYLRLIGHSVLKNDRPFKDSTLCFMGSFSKLMVASAMLKLQESNKLLVEDRVIKLFRILRPKGILNT